MKNPPTLADMCAGAMHHRGYLGDLPIQREALGFVLHDYAVEKGEAAE